MLLLTSTSDKIQVVTSAISAIDVHASWIDNNAGTITPGRTNTASITTATTTDVVGSPGASTQRNVKGLYVTNTHASAATQVTVQHTDGTNVKQIMGVTLLAGENLNFDAEGEWHHRDAQGAEYFPAFPPFDAYAMGYGVTGCIAESVPRYFVDSTQALVSGTLVLAPIYLRAGQKITNVSFYTTVASGTPTHGLFGIYNSALSLQATTADFTSEAWAINTIKTKALTSVFTVPTTGLYFIAVMIAATTAPTMVAKGSGTVAIKALAPNLGGTTTNTGLTTALPATATISAGLATTVWGYVS